MAELLKAEKVSEVFGGLKAVSDFDFHINQGELVGLIGPNGAGKTTAFNLFTGVYQPTTGTITFDGKSIVGLKPYEITQRGIARTFQNIRLFSELTVLENVKIAFHFHVKYGLLESVLRVGRYFHEEEQIEAESMKLLKIFHLEDKADEVAKNLPYGAQRRLEIARALAAKPKLLLLDEPAAGMNPQETKELMEMIRWIRKEFGLTVLLIEHDMSLVMGICERIYVLEYGMVIASGTPDVIKNDPEVIRAHLGAGASAREESFSMKTMLKLNDINVYYGAIHAIKGISLEVNEGEIVTLIGANGAGKSTTLRTVSGLRKPKTGSIQFEGRDIAGMPAHEIVKTGISQVPEGRRIFAEMSVMENLDMGAFIRKDKDGVKQDLKMVFERLPRLEERKDQVAGTLSGGEQQMLAMGRALMSRPRLLLLDEPSMGLAPLLIKEIFEIIVDINKGGTTVLLVEQNANMALSIANRAYVLETGRITLSGDAATLAASEDVRKAYLGG